MASSPLNIAGDSSLIARRDANAHEELLRRYRALLQELAKSADDPILRGKVHRSELVQQTCLDVLRGFRLLRATGSIQFSVWLRTLFQNNIRQFQRAYLAPPKCAVFAERSLSENLEADHAQCTASTPPPMDSLLQAERLERLRAALDRLPSSLQRVLKWRFEDGLTLGQNAERVERSEDAVRMLVSRCLPRLRPEIFDDESKL